MANWYYYGKTGEKVGPVSATSLKELALQGLITPETKLENSTGRTAVAGQVNGLTFAETKQPETTVYGLGGDFNFPDLTSEGNTPDDYDPFANTGPSAVAKATFDNSNALTRRTSGTSHQEKYKPVLLDWILLDFRFRFFLTPLLLKIIWCTWVVLIEFLILALVLGLLFSGISYMLPGTSESTATDMWESPPMSHGIGIDFLITRLLPLILIPLFVATFLLCIRIVLECAMIVFRIGEHLKNIDMKT